MPFHDEFDPIWENAIKPAIESSEYGLSMKANRVKESVLSDSALMNILDGIAHSALIFVDVSIAKKGKWTGQRNGNVMYELGLAHAVRPATDVVVVRCDDDPINFDVAGINIRSYTSSDTAGARKKFVTFLRDALAQRDKTMSLLMETVGQRLDAFSRNLMMEFGANKKFEPFAVGLDEAFQRHLVIQRLLDLGIILCEIPKHEHFRYVWTDFGKAVYWNPNMVKSSGA